MKLCDILQGIDIDTSDINPDTDIKDIVFDSRKAEQDTLFVCISGYQVDGHDYAIKAYGESKPNEYADFHLPKIM